MRRWSTRSSWSGCPSRWQSRCRQATRFEFQEKLPVYEKDSYRQIGELVDLSTLGVRLISKQAVESGTLISCRVSLPKPVFGREYLNFEAKCMWSHRCEFAVEYESGYQFCRLSEEDAAIVLHLLIHSATKRMTEPRRQVVR
ncbi:MAG TPA: PilZ domain-containing protein [candidate division Zixibacteria bacterium]|nr:PilZ domain-containing protein [candidate division Zixibacteria bacterium]